MLHQKRHSFKSLSHRKADAAEVQQAAFGTAGAKSANAQGSGVSKQAAGASVQASEAVGTISIDDLVKVQLIACTIEAAEEVPGSDKLIKMQINAGPLGMRQVLAGIKKELCAGRSYR